MQVELPYLVQDQLTAERKGMRSVESFRYSGNEIFLDGPVCRRIAILDFDDATGELLPPLPFRPPARGRKLGRYEIEGNREATNRDFQRLSVFATILKTIRAFEGSDVLGRELTWAFDAPQLLVVPRAGKWANAFYERESHSLQFFFFEPQSQPGKQVFTSLSHDIVTHETGHAILDGIAPGLYDAITPQSLALHEAIADLTSLVLSLESGVLRKTVLDQMGGRIDAPTAFSAVAEEFGHALGQGKLHLRSLWNDKTLNPHDRSRDEHGEPNYVSRAEPHDLSQVLSGALYSVLVRLHGRRLDLRTADIDDPGEKQRRRFRESGKELAVAAMMFRRFVFRSLDYLPPGEISFADFGRAVIAADISSNPEASELRQDLGREFERRGIVLAASDLSPQQPVVGEPLGDVDLATLLDSDWAAYQFVEANRERLGVPADIPFRVLPRLDVEKTTWRTTGEARFRELILKVAWEHKESNAGVGLRSDWRAVTVGITLAIDMDSRLVKAYLCTSTSGDQADDRSAFLRRLLDEELIAHDGVPADGAAGIEAQATGGVLRVKGGARSLHLAAEVA